MTIQDQVTAALAERAAGIVDAQPDGRARDAMQRARRTQRRRLVAAATMAALVAGGVTVQVLEGGDGGTRSLPAGPTVHIRETYADRHLITSSFSVGGRPLVLTVNAPTGGSDWQLTCSGVSPQVRMHWRLDDGADSSAPCSTLARLGETASFRFTSAGPAGSGRRLDAWVVGPPGVPLGDAVLRAAVYALPEPIAMLAGFDVQAVEEVDGLLWKATDWGESQLGRGTYTRRFAAYPEETMLEVLSAGSGRATVEVLVDGFPLPTNPDPLPLGSVTLTRELAANAAHEVTVRIVGEVPPDARLALVRRVPAP